MQNNFLFTFALICFALNLHAQKDDGILLPEFKNLEEHQLRGTVKSITIKSYKADEFEDSLKNANQASPLLHEELYFDSLGRLELALNLNAPSKSAYRYDSLDRIIEIHYQSKNTCKSGTKEFFEWIPSDSLLQIKSSTDSLCGEGYNILSLYHKDKQGNIVKTQTIHNGQESSIYKYEYDSLNRIVKSQWISTSSGSVNSEWVYSYNRANQITKWVKTDRHGNLKESHEFQYDPYGNPIKDRSDNGSTLSWEYLYDDHGNWVKSIRQKNGLKDIIVIRTIEYYAP